MISPSRVCTKILVAIQCDSRLRSILFLLSRCWKCSVAALRRLGVSYPISARRLYCVMTKILKELATAFGGRSDRRGWLGRSKRGLQATRRTQPLLPGAGCISSTCQQLALIIFRLPSKLLVFAVWSSLERILDYSRPRRTQPTHLPLLL